MANPLTGYTSSKAEPLALHTNVNPVAPYRNGIDTASHLFVELIAADTAEASSTSSSIIATAHVARVGDLLRFSSGANNQLVVSVIETAVNSISLGQELLVAPGIGDSFDVLRYRPPLVDSGGNIQVETNPNNEASVPAYGEVVGTSITSSYQTILTVSGDAKIICVLNTCNKPLLVSFDNGVTDHVKTDGESLCVDLAINGLKMTSPIIRVKHAGVVPTSGSIRVTVFK